MLVFGRKDANIFLKNETRVFKYLLRIRSSVND